MKLEAPDEQTIAVIVLRAASAEEWRPAFMLHPQHAGGKAAAAIRRMPGLFERKMGGAQCLVYRLTPQGKRAADAIERGEPFRSKEDE